MWVLCYINLIYYYRIWEMKCTIYMSFSVQYGLRKLGDDFFVFFSLVNGLLLKFVPVCLCVIWLYYFEGD